MPSNKQRDLQKKQLEKTGKNQTIYYAVSVCPAIENKKVVFNIVKIGFTLSGECVTIETVDKADNEPAAFVKLQSELMSCGTTDIRYIRNQVKKLKEENEKETDE